MGVYATVAVVVSMLYYFSTRRQLQNVKDKGGPDAPLTPTNFHQKASESRPNKGQYYQPAFKIFNN